MDYSKPTSFETTTSTVNTKKAQSQSQSKVNYITLTPDTWVPSNHILGVVKKPQGSLAKFAAVKYISNTSPMGEQFYLMLPKMLVPFGVSDPRDYANKNENDQHQTNYSMNQQVAQQSNQSQGQGQSNKYTISFSFADNTSQLLQKFRDFDDCVLTRVIQCKDKNGGYEWFTPKFANKTNIPLEDQLKISADSLYNRSVKEPKSNDAVYPCRIVASIKRDKNGSATTGFFSYDKTPIENIDFDNRDSQYYIKKIIPSRSECSALLSCQLYGAAGKFGVQWRVEQIRIYPTINAVPRDRCIIGDDDDENENENESDNDDCKFQTTEHNRSKSNAFVEDPVDNSIEME